MRGLILVAVLAGTLAGIVSGVVVGVILDDNAEPAPRADAAEPAAGVQTAVEAVLPSLVTIEAESPPDRDPQGRLRVQGAIGTGVVMDADGHILTNEHVIRDADQITVILADGERRPAQILGTDSPFTDIAVLATEGDGLAPATFGPSAGLKAGQTVIALGNALMGSSISVTVGVVSNPDARFPRDNQVQDRLIQTDAALNHGNSGGALATLNGEVVGLTTTIARETEDGGFVDGVGFALQADAILPIAERIIANGFYPRPTFGEVDVRMLNPFVAEQLNLTIDEGAFLFEFTRGGAFAQAGLEPGDVIVRMNGVEITQEMPFLNVLRELTPLEPVEIVYHRDGEEHTVTIAPELRRP